MFIMKRLYKCSGDPWDQAGRLQAVCNLKNAHPPEILKLIICAKAQKLKTVWVQNTHCCLKIICVFSLCQLLNEKSDYKHKFYENKQLKCVVLRVEMIRYRPKYY